MIKNWKDKIEGQSPRDEKYLKSKYFQVFMSNRHCLYLPLHICENRPFKSILIVAVENIKYWRNILQVLLQN